MALSIACVLWQFVRRIRECRRAGVCSVGREGIFPGHYFGVFGRGERLG